MSSAVRSSLATRSPRDPSAKLSPSIPELFRSKAANMAPTGHGSPPATNPPPSSRSYAAVTSGDLEPSSPSPEAPRQLCMDDLHSIAADIKETLGAAIMELRADIHSLTGRVLDIERVTAHQDSAIHDLYYQTDAHAT